MAEKKLKTEIRSTLAVRAPPEKKTTYFSRYQMF